MNVPFFNKKLGSAHSTKSSLLWHENFDILVPKASDVVVFSEPKIALLFGR